MRLARYAAQTRRLRQTVLILTCALNCSREYRAFMNFNIHKADIDFLKRVLDDMRGSLGQVFLDLNFAS